MAYFNQPQGLEFREVVLQHLKKILELSTSEFQRCVKVRYDTENKSSTKFVEDNRKAFCQAVETFSAILIPHFDKQMKESYSKHIKILEQYPHEYYKAEKQNVSKILNEIGKDNIKLYDQAENFLIKSQLHSAKTLFKELNLLLNRVDYLKKSVYSEGDIEEAEYHEEPN